MLVFAFTANAAPIDISTEHPGGNVTVVSNEEAASVTLKPDLRGGRDWFYWNFDATATAPGEIEFVIEGKLRIGVRGPAVSKDEGKTWNWLGNETVRYFDAKKDDPKTASESFRYTFTAKDDSVRFAVAIPYQKADLDQFITQSEGNPHFLRQELTKSRGGKSVDLLKIGSGNNTKSIIVSARHHACESMASYVLEGFLAEAMSESVAANAFRERYTIYAVPMMDSDGVEAGDQGKWRFPHDHNRDYGEGAIYPEVQALMKLGAKVKPALALDFHCPSLRGETHEVFYFIGVALPHIKDNTNELIGWIGEECPQIFPRGPHNFLRDPPEEVPAVIKDTKFSVWFAFHEGVDFAATFEIPYSQRSFDFTPDVARSYGRSLLRAWERTEYISNPKEKRSNSFSEFQEFRKKFMAGYKSNPNAMTDMAAAKDNGTVYASEKSNISGLSALRKRNYEEAANHFRTASGMGAATKSQQLLSTVHLVVTAARNPDSTTKEVLAAIERFDQFPYPSRPGQFDAFGAAAEFFAENDDVKRAIEFTNRQLPNASAIQRGATLNKLADLLLQVDKNQEAVQARREAVAHLRSQLEPTMPVGIFGALMSHDLFEAVSKIPDAKREEIEAAAEMVFQHRLSSTKVKDAVRAALRESEAAN